MLLVVLGGLLAAEHRGRPSTAADSLPGQRTLLLALRGPAGQGVAALLLGADAATGQADGLLIPSSVMVDPAAAAAMPFGRTVGLAGRTAASAALTDLLGVRVQSQWALTPASLAGLVDRLGGVTVSVDRDVVQTGTSGVQTVVVPVGRARIDGAQAAAYAAYLAPGEPEAARLARFGQVIDAVLLALPTSPAAAAAVLAPATVAGASSVRVDHLASLLVTAASEDRAGRITYSVLPTRPIDTGGAALATGLDQSAASVLVQGMFAGSLLSPPGQPAVRVLVESAPGEGPAVLAARSRLIGAGYRFVNGSTTGSAPLQSLVLVPDASAGSLAVGRRVATTLHLPASAVQVSAQGQDIAGVVVVIGVDFPGG